MMDNDKWVWADAEDSSPLGIPILDAKLTPIVEWPDLKPELPSPGDPPEQAGVKPEEKAVADAAATAPPVPPAEAPAPGSAKRHISPSVVRAIVLHLEGRLEKAIQEIQIGLQDGEPATELYAAMGALQ